MQEGVTAVKSQTTFHVLCDFYSRDLGSGSFSLWYVWGLNAHFLKAENVILSEAKPLNPWPLHQNTFFTSFFILLNKRFKGGKKKTLTHICISIFLTMHMKGITWRLKRIPREGCLDKQSYYGTVNDRKTVKSDENLISVSESDFSLFPIPELFSWKTVKNRSGILFPWEEDEPFPHCFLRRSSKKNICH